MPDWLQILLIIIITLGVIAGLLFSGLIIYRNITKPGTCQFIPYSPATKVIRPVPTYSVSDSNYTQTGYVACTGGGSAWKPTAITIFNQGPGDFYIGPVQGQADPQLISAGQYYNYTFIGSVEPNIYYVPGSTTTEPNLTISIS